MCIKVSEDKRRILLSTAHTSYGLVVNDNKRLCNAYWGSKLYDIDDLPLESELENYPFEELEHRQWYQQEYSGWGGYFYDEPCLKLAAGQAKRALRLSVKDIAVLSEENGESLQIELQSEFSPILVTLFYHVSYGSDVITRYAKVKNEGSSEFIFSNVYSGAIHLPGQIDYDIRYLAGKWAGEHQIRQTSTTQGKFVLESRRGISGPDANPWIVLTPSGQGNEEIGDAYSCAIQWNGNWKLCIEKNRYEQVTVLGGWNDYDDLISLMPAVELETPHLLLTYSSKGFGGVSRQMHQHIRGYMPQRNDTTKNPLIYNSWEACFFDFNIDMQLKLAEKAAKIGAEIFVVDDGWFTNRNNDHAGLGDWLPDTQKFPEGLLPLSKRVQELGMVFGLWAEPEMVSPSSELARKHPEWIISFDIENPPLARHQLVLNLARNDVKEYVISVWDKLINDNEIGYIKWDMNRYICEPGWHGNSQPMQSVWRDYANNLYDVLETLTHKYPNLIIENCCSGGGRSEAGMYRYCRIVSRSDNADTLDGLKLFEGYTQAYPPETAIASVSSCPNGINGRTVPLEYRVNMAMMGTMQIGLNLNTLDNSELDELKEYAKTYKRLRPTVQNAALYRLVSAYNQPYAVYQFVSHDKSHSVVFIFGQTLQFRKLLPRVKLKGLAPDAKYRIDGKLYSGDALMKVGVPLRLNGDYATLKWEIVREDVVFEDGK